jgi:NDP-sugar pyrophosphorylase family protein
VTVGLAGESKHELLTVAILAGGLATRLRPVTEKVPKSLLDLNGEPFIVHQLRLLHSNGVRNVVLCVGFLGEMIQDEIGDGRSLGVHVEYSFDGDRLLGTAGAIKKALPYLGDAFFVLYGDSYLVCDYAAVGRAFQSSGKLGLMTVFRNEGKWDTSNVEYEDGRILAYDKKNRTPRMGYIDYGLGVFSARAFDRVPADKVFDLADLYAQLLAERELAGIQVSHRFYEIGSVAGLQETAEFLAAQRVAHP